MPMAILSMALGIAGFNAVTAAADDGSVETVGGAVRLMKTQSGVRMVSETVKARVGPDLVQVDCEFVMKNEGPADTATLDGIPLERIVATNPEARRAGRTFRWTFHDFEPGSGDAPDSVELGWRVSTSGN